jgi:hypothetical protein
MSGGIASEGRIRLTGDPLEAVVSPLRFSVADLKHHPLRLSIQTSNEDRNYVMNLQHCSGSNLGSVGLACASWRLSPSQLSRPVV